MRAFLRAQGFVVRGHNLTALLEMAQRDGLDAEGIDLERLDLLSMQYLAPRYPDFRSERQIELEDIG